MLFRPWLYCDNGILTVPPSGHIRPTYRPSFGESGLARFEVSDESADHGPVLVALRLLGPDEIGQAHHFTAGSIR
jgi:hypothetical protein